ncbi:MAG: pyridoxamine 5'-phosphate oxidase [Oceanicoccus sp.]|jgi:pyridoxamine 5'-phosphate oxidase
MSKSFNITGDRREYDHGNLRREELDDSPIKQFEGWLRKAKELEVRDATAMTLATVDDSGMPYQRMVLLKGLDERGFVFFTNLGSRKAQHIKANAKVSLHFSWLPLDRQVIINGVATPLSKVDNLRYFVSRPRESQLAAWASRQSHPISARRVLEEKYLEIKEAFGDGKIDVPDFWGGYRVDPVEIEFWQGGEYRLHDRFVYTRAEDQWDISRLSP